MLTGTVLDFAFIRFHLDHGLNVGRMGFNFRLIVTCRDVLVMIVRIGLGKNLPTERRLGSTMISSTAAHRVSPDLLLL